MLLTPFNTRSIDLEKDISTDLHILQDHLESMLARIQHNSLTLKRFQVFEINLLKLNSLTDMLEHLLGHTKTFFDLDVVSLCLIDKNGLIEKFLQDGAYKKNKGLVFLANEELLESTFGLSPQPFLGTYKQAKCSLFFSGSDRKPVSVAILPLCRRGQLLGSLNFGSYTAHRFINDMATDFIEHMVAVVSLCLENHLNFETLRRTRHIDPLIEAKNSHFHQQQLNEALDNSQRNIPPLHSRLMR